MLRASVQMVNSARGGLAMKHVPPATAMLAIAVCLTPSSAPAASITIIEDSSEIVTPLVMSDLEMLDIRPNFDMVSVTGRITPRNSATFFTNPVTPGTRSVLLMEPAADPFGSRTSDFLTLTVDQIGEDPTGLFQLVAIAFVSDLAPGFADAVRRLPAGTPAVMETGGPQVLSTQLNSGAFAITGQSDFAPLPEIPEPASLLLLGAGLLSLSLLRPKRRERDS
jgi:hypothetical protein